MKTKIAKNEFKECAKKLVLDSTLQKLETEHFIFMRVDGSVTVKFKNIDGLTGYFTMEEIQNPKTLTVILKTVENEMGKKLKEVSYETEKN